MDSIEQKTLTHIQNVISSGQQLAEYWRKMVREKVIVNPARDGEELTIFTLDYLELAGILEQLEVCKRIFEKHIKHPELVIDMNAQAAAVAEVCAKVFEINERFSPLAVEQINKQLTNRVN